MKKNLTILKMELLAPAGRPALELKVVRWLSAECAQTRS